MSVEIHGLHGRTVADDYDYLAGQVEKAHEIGEHPPNAKYTLVYIPMWQRMIAVALRAEAARLRSTQSEPVCCVGGGAL